MSLLETLTAPARPTLGIEITATRVTLVRLGTGGGQRSITAYAVEPLPPGAVTPALNAANIADRAAVVAALRRGLERVGSRPRQAAVVVPDTVARVSLLRFEKVPPRAADFEELIRWQVRKSAPFRVEDGQLGWMPAGAAADGTREFAVSLARRDVVQEYEGVCAEAGLAPGIVDLATFNLANAVIAGGAPAGDWLLVNVAPDYLTLAIMRGTELIFFRHRGAEDGSLADGVHQTAMYYEDRLGGSGFTRAVLASAGAAAAAVDSDEVRRQLEQRLQLRVEPVDPRSAVSLTDRISATPDLLGTLAPAVGVLLREHAA